MNGIEICTIEDMLKGKYRVIIGGEVICEFRHKKSEGLAKCLAKAGRAAQKVIDLRKKEEQRLKDAPLPSNW